MSYRLITKATFTVKSASGTESSREVEVRAYPAPKRDASGQITVDGNVTSYKRTGGKGRGTADTRYIYATVAAQSAYWALTEAEATALVGGTATLATIAPATPAEPAPAATPAEPAPERAPRRVKHTA